MAASSPPMACMLLSPEEHRAWKNIAKKRNPHPPLYFYSRAGRSRVERPDGDAQQELLMCMQWRDNRATEPPIPIPADNWEQHRNCWVNGYVSVILVDYDNLPPRLYVWNWQQ